MNEAVDKTMIDRAGIVAEAKLGPELQKVQNIIISALMKDRTLEQVKAGSGDEKGFVLTFQTKDGKPIRFKAAISKL